MSNNIVLISKQDNIKSLSVAITSTLENANSKINYVINILFENECSINNINSFDEFEKRYNCTVNIKIIEDLKNKNIENIAIVVANSLPLIDKCIYLDFDVIVQRDLSELHDIELKDFYLAGVKDTEDEEINSSVLLINCTKIREDKIKDIELNLIKLIDLKYNLRADSFNHEYTFKFSSKVMMKPSLQEMFDVNQIKQALKSNVIFSYQNNINPFNDFDCSFVNEWYKYFNKSLLTGIEDIKIPKISVIVPVYNVENYLNLCIESIVNQTYKNLEIILVDDGSTDNSGLICYDWLKKDNRITVIHKENKGLSSARNYGMDLAKGEYISFVDSDDYIHPQTFSLAMEVFKENEDLDLVEYEFKNEYESDSKYCDLEFIRITNSKYSITTSEEYLEFIRITNSKYSITTSEEYLLANINYKKHYHIVCNKLFKRDLIKDKRFIVGKCHEDVFFSNEYMFDVTKVGYIPNRIYYYLKREDSIVNQDITIKNVDGVDGLYQRHILMKNNYPNLLELDLKYALNYGYRRLNNLVEQGNDYDKSIRIAFMDSLLKFDDSVEKFASVQQIIKDDFILAKKDMDSFIYYHEKRRRKLFQNDYVNFNYTLHVVNTVYQLFNTINYRLNVADINEKADIILSDHTPALKEYFETLKESNLFDNVYLISTIGICRMPVLAPENKDVMFRSKEIIATVSDIDVELYDNLFCTNFDLFDRMLFTANNKMSVRYCEDGLSVYYMNRVTPHPILRKLDLYSSIANAIVSSYTYSPDLYQREVNYNKFKLPKIDINDNEFVALINKIFKVNLPIKLPKFIFLEQCFEDENIICDDLKLIEILSETVGKENLYIKTHPRSKRNRTKHLGVSEELGFNCPMEALLMNMDLENHVLITVNSTAVSSINFIFEEDTPIMYLCNFIEFQNSNYRKNGDFINNYAEVGEYENIMLPSSKDEYIEMLSKLI